jgi:F0F1-type ATP synthase delta subunit
MSFSADPSPQFTQKLAAWLRQEIHPFVLLQVGLQPNIGAGCVVRTTNKYFDFSLRERFKSKRPLLMEKLKSLGTKVEVVQVGEAHA